MVNEAALFSAHEDPKSPNQPVQVEADQPKPKVKSRKFWGTITAAVSGFFSWLVSNSTEMVLGFDAAANRVSDILPMAPTLSTVFITLSLLGAALAIYAQFDDAKKARA